VTSYFELVQGVGFELGLVSTARKKKPKQNYIFEGRGKHQKCEK